MKRLILPIGFAIRIPGLFAYGLRGHLSLESLHESRDAFVHWSHNRPRPSIGGSVAVFAALAPCLPMSGLLDAVGN